MTERADVVVVGGGTAGFGAAVAAGRQGLEVLLLEAGPKLGGVMAFCPGMPWGGGYPCDAIVGGLIEELTTRLARLDPPAAEKRPCALENFGPEILYDPDMAQIVMFEMLDEAGVRVHLNATVSRPVMEWPRIAAVEYFDRHGAHLVVPRVIVDCSGDGDLSAKAGVGYQLGDGKGNMMGVTLSFLMVGARWDEVFAENDPYFRRYAEKGVADGRLHRDLSMLYLMKGFHRDTVFCNSVHIRGVDGTDPAAVNRATLEGRRRCRQLADFLRSDVPGFAGAWMTSLGPTVGVRETRKLEGVYRLTARDVTRGVKFADGIVACANPVDDVMRGEDGAMTHDASVHDGAWYTVPFRSLVPREVENLLFAGRIVSADPTAFASLRGMPQCMTMGQAAGNAAALAIRDGVAVQQVDPAAVSAIMRSQGVWGLAADRHVA